MTATDPLAPAVPTASPWMKRIRGALILGGLGVIGIGGLVLLFDVKPAAYIGILIWFAGAIVVHDAIIGPAVFGVAVIMRKFGRRIPIVVLAIIQVALVIAALMTALVLPEVVAKQRGSANPTILPLDYVVNLGVFYVGLGVLTAVVVAGYLLTVSRREKRRTADQD